MMTTTIIIEAAQYPKQAIRPPALTQEHHRALRLDPQTKDFGMSGWECTLEINGRVETFTGGREDLAVEKAWEWLQANPIEGDDWGAS